MKKVVAIGGGTGLSTLLRGLRKYPLDISAIVTMTDNGASTGRLRRDLNILPPGDIRKCIAALSEDESLLVDLFQYRFKKGFGLTGHSLGNLLITALKDITGSFDSAVEEMSRLLSINGKVLPASFEQVDLVGEFNDGKKIIGEAEVTKYGHDHKLKRISLSKKAKANIKAVEAIENADLILIGPGSLYTSILPNFLIKQIKEGLNNSAAPKIFICNVSTEKGETENFCVEDHLTEFAKYNTVIDRVLVNNNFFPDKSGDGFVYPVKTRDNNEKFIFADLLNEENFLYHDSDKLGQQVYDLAFKLKKRKKVSFISK